MRRLDLALVALYLVGVIGAGAALSRRQRSTRQYFLGGRRIPWWAISASIVATETSTITFISVPGIAYARGGDFRFLQLALGYVVGRVAIAVFLLPAYFRGELLTAYSLLATRFSSVVRALASILFIVMRTVGDGVRLLVTAGVLDEIRHWIDDDARGDWLPGAVVVLGVVTILFTLLGGMEAVLWIEVAQLAIYLAGAVAAAVVLATRVPGGIPSAFDLAESSGKLHLFDFTFDLTQRYTFWSGLVGGALLTMAVQGTEQFFVQRYLCTDDVRGAKRAVVASGVVVLAQFALFLGIGVLLFAFYRPDVTASAPPLDKAFPTFIARELPPGIAGFVVAAIFAAAFSSSLNSIAASAVHDLLRPVVKTIDDARALTLARWLTVAAGVAQIAVALAFLGSSGSAVDHALGAASLLYGPILGVFLLGLCVPRAASGAAIAGLVAGAAAAGFVWLGTDVAWPWYTAVGSAVTLAVGAAVARLR